MRQFFFILSAMICLCSCKKDNVDTSKIFGTWHECYDDPNFIMDGYVTYTFDKDGTCTLHSYDALSGNEYVDKHQYTITDKVITLTTAATESEASTSYRIVRLDDKEMAWQKTGTEYSTGSFSNDYKHFRKE